MDNEKSLFEIILAVLKQYQDINLLSEEVKYRIAEDICIMYYDEIDPEIIDHEDLI